MVTCGLLVFAVLVSAGMAEWSKRQAASETVIDPAVMQEALKIAAAAAAGSGSRVASGELPATSNPKPVPLRSERAGVEK